MLHINNLLLVDQGHKEHKSAVHNGVLIDLVSRFSVQIVEDDCMCLKPSVVVHFKEVTDEENPMKNV